MRGERTGSQRVVVFPLGSGSKGNSVFVGTPLGGVLVDAGFSLKRTRERLAEADIPPESIRAILITHEHWDHVAGLGPLARALKVPVYMTEGTYSSLKTRSQFKDLPQRARIVPGEPFSVAGIRVDPLPIPHDAAEPVAFAMAWEEHRWAIVTDFGYPTTLLEQKLRGCDYLFLEANHDEEMLVNGPYPWPLKTRIRGRFGHLSNTQSASFLQRIAHPGLKGLVLMHLSETNNKPELPYALCRRTLDKLGADDVPVWVASQYRPLMKVAFDNI
ncbi:MBL fold metallo-hydrolase [Candidatus Parcubacteria bacterium]|nr:MAG: MBL fold metallo-hydrolase [Candidatus Parcubacteria bacterium]